MGDGANVFNTFSFNKWADGKREEEIDKESRRRRAEQIKRLKERLRKERALREAQGDGDLDLDALIEAIQNGQEINGEPEGEPDEPTNETAVNPRRSGLPDVLTDDYVFNEIEMFSKRNREMRIKAADTNYSVPPEIKKPDPLSWQFNRRNAENTMAIPEEKPQNNFKFNRKLNS